MTTCISHSPAETEYFGETLAATLRPGDVVALTGDLAAGKTRFVAGLARGLGLSDTVTSPTFAIAHEYREGKVPLFHFDMYRLKSSEELYDIGWEDYLRAGGICAIEWTENVADAMPRRTVWVDIRILDDTTREFQVTDGREGEVHV
ncbi:MAG: tRNA (adenosine(37)-N6)-threonylcarbamoyltransferase complex ATPase subunit type 1 TsaE [Clostridiaceae bacterium]|nr:tRNA (adenosine(37)-N6)-threonylcarbamoyltransferase complex ATPase subunit type 1 TsaE [Clostridiaceae bacterium]